MTARENRAESLSVRFRIETLEWLRAFAEDNDLSLSSVVNMAVKDFVKKQNALKQITDKLQDPENIMKAVGAYQSAGGDISFLTGDQISIDDLLAETEKGD